MTATSGWKKCRLEEIALIQGGGTPKRSEPRFFGGDIPWVTPTDLPAVGRITELVATRETITRKGLASSSATLIAAGSVLFSTRASIGKIAVTDRECATNQGFANFTPLEGVLDPWFLAYLLCRYTPEIARLAGKTTFREVSRGKLKAFEVAVPPLGEQRRIVARIKECMERVEEIESLRESQRVEIGLLQDNALDALLDDSWPTPQLADLVTDIRNGWSGRQQADAPETSMLRLSCVHSKYVDTSQVKAVRVTRRAIEDCLVKKGNVFVVRGNGSPHLVGRSAIAGQDHKDIIFNDLLIRIRFGANVLLSFANLAFHTPARTRADPRRG